MSKYIDKEKVLEYVKTYQAQLALGMIGKDVDSGDLIKAIDVLPTIEVSEDAISDGAISYDYIKGYREAVQRLEKFYLGEAKARNERTEE